MTIREWKDRIVGNPWIYDNIRPLVAGWIDLNSLAQFCSITPEDRVFDLGCGTGQLVQYFRCEQYVGVDTDQNAIKKASQHSTLNMHFVLGDDWDATYRELHATIVIMIGLLHHLPDSGFASIISRLRAVSQALPRIVTIDISYFPHMYLNNLLSRMDRGQYVRRPEEYERLFKENGLRLLGREFIPTRLRYVRYVGYQLG
jgi:SAM-dependent methyltransferase